MKIEIDENKLLDLLDDSGEKIAMEYVIDTIKMQTTNSLAIYKIWRYLTETENEKKARKLS